VSGFPRLRKSFRALRHRNFRLFLTGQVISLTGTWMQQVAVAWLVYRLTRSALLLGLVGFAGQIPGLVLAPFAGVWVDRVDRLRLVVLTQALSMVQALALAVLVLGGSVRVWHVVALGVFLGLVNALDIPARQAFLVEMVGGREDLSNAIALNSSAFNAARLVGPSIAGFALARLSEGMVFLVNALSYVAVIAALLAMKVPARAARVELEPFWKNLREGIAYAAGFAPIRIILMLIVVVSFAGVPFTVLMPVFATEVLHGGARTLGLLTSALGLGALAGALTLAARASVRGLGRVIAASGFVFGGSLTAFSFSTALPLSLLLLFLSGYGMMALTASSNTVLQTIVEDEKRGRVMSFYAAAFMGTVPLGSLIAGALAERIGASLTVRLGGIACLVAALTFARALPVLRVHIRPIYVRLGIVPELAAGVASAGPAVVADAQSNSPVPMAESSAGPAGPTPSS
jgi:MFS family permease